MTSGEASIITQLVQEVAAMNARWDESEKARALLRQQDEHWRDRMEEKTDKLYRCMDNVSAAVSEVPCVVDARIAACRSDHDRITADAISDAKARRTNRAVMSVQLRVALRILVVVALVAAGVAAITDHDTTTLLALLAAATPYVVLQLRS
jgi:Flp pilus assembly protein TadB